MTTETDTTTEPVAADPEEIIVQAADVETEDTTSFLGRTAHVVSVPFVAVGHFAESIGHGIRNRVRAANNIRRGRHVMQAMMRKQLLEVGRNARSTDSQKG